MCGCRAHRELVDCTCLCDHAADRITQWRARAEAAEAKLAEVRELATEPGSGFPYVRQAALLAVLDGTEGA